jgi:hypothetical protein
MCASCLLPVYAAGVGKQVEKTHLFGRFFSRIMGCDESLFAVFLEPNSLAVTEL